MIDISKDTYTEKLLDFILTTFLATHRIQPPVQNKSSRQQYSLAFPSNNLFATQRIQPPLQNQQYPLAFPTAIDHHDENIT